MPNQGGRNADKGEVRPWQGTALARRSKRVLAGGLVAAAAACAFAATARAAESTWPTAQAKAYNFDFVPYLDPPAKPAAICLVDSGVDITPDTPADSENGPILERTSLDGGPGTGLDSDHGTYMAMTAGAPMNDWGTVGLWPGLRIVSIRVMPKGGHSFPFDDYRRAILICAKSASRLNIKVVNLSLDCSCSYKAVQLTDLEDTVADAHTRYGLNVVASGGNSASAVSMPARASGVFAVAAADGALDLCSFSNRGDGIDLLAAGCQMDGAWPTTGAPFVGWNGGTSAAAAITSSALALLRTYNPSLSWQQSEDLLAGSADVRRGAVLDMASAFRAAGATDALEGARENMPAWWINSEQPPAATVVSDGPASLEPTPTYGQGHAADPQPTESHLARGLRAPTVDNILRLGRRLTVSVNNRPRGGMLVLALQRRSSEFQYLTVTHIQRATDTISVTMPRLWRAGRIALQYEALGTPIQRSRVRYREVRR